MKKKNKILTTHTICFIADGHTLYDDRLYWKEALSLISKGYNIIIIVIDSVDEQGITEHGIKFYKIKRKVYTKNKILNHFLNRMHNKTYSTLIKKLNLINSTCFHIHDSNLNKIIKKIPPTTRLIYDAREPLKENIIDFSNLKGIKKTLLKWYAHYLQKKEYKSAKLYDLILTVDDGLKNKFIKNISNKKVDVIYNYTAQIKDRKNIAFKDKIYDAIYSGGITEIRGFYTIIKSAKIIAKQNKKFKLLLLGIFYEENLKKELFDFIKKNKLGKNIIWIDFVRHDEVSYYYNLSKIGLNILYPLPSHQEIQQIKLFEYMNFGLPIISSNFGEMKNIILNNKVGLVVNPYDENELAIAILTLLSNQEKYNEYSKNGIQAVNEKYNWGLMEKKLLKLYSELLDK